MFGCNVIGITYLCSGYRFKDHFIHLLCSVQAFRFSLFLPDRGSMRGHKYCEAHETRADLRRNL